jgi:hydroxymethylglutaryl-CoA reductase (NADPH)
MFPAAVLARLFVKGSLKNTPDGFEFKLKNIIDSGTITGLSLSLDETVLPAEAVTVVISGKELNGGEITSRTPVTVWAYVELTLKVAGAPLTPGSHQINFQILTREAGKLQFSVNEELA